MQPPAAPSYGAGATIPQLATWGQRFGASLLDFVIVMVPLGIVLGAAGVGTFRSGDDGVNYSVGNLGSVINMAVWFLYTALMHQRGGQTLGKRIVKIRVVAEGGAPLDTKTWIRSGVQTVLWVTCLGGLLDHLWPLWDKNRQTLHDKAAATYVVTAG